MGVIGTSRPLPAWSEVVVAVGVGMSLQFSQDFSESVSPTSRFS